MKESEGCSRCILPEEFPGIAFDDQGVCSLCSEHKTSSVLGEAKLREVLSAGSGRVYDCVVPISGGKDSTYVLYYAVEMLNRKSIAVNYDSGFQSDLATQNVRTICNRLKVPLVVVRADFRTQVRMLRAVLGISEIMGTFFHTCMNCEVSIRTSAINTAKKYDVPFILYGSSKLERIGKQPFLGRKAFLSKISRRDVPRLCFYIVTYSIYSIHQRMQMKVPISHRFQPIGSVALPREKPRVIHFFDYVEWDPMDKEVFLKEELGWKSPRDRQDRFDCLLHCFGNHHWLQACGLSVDGFIYSAMIRENRMTREQALLRERVITEGLEEECLEVAKMVGLEGYKTPRI